MPQFIFIKQFRAPNGRQLWFAKVGNEKLPAVPSRDDVIEMLQFAFLWEPQA